MLQTVRQERFVSEYMVDLNGQQAAIRAGYSSHTAKVQASRLLSHVNVQKLVQERQRECERRLELHRDDILRGLIGAAKLAKEQGEPQVVINALKEISKLQGHYSHPSECLRDVACWFSMIKDMSIDRNDNKDVCLRCSPPKAYPCNQRIPAPKARAHDNL
ncbi:MAG: terminase small subunit, partial [Gammaproteobacteria bacterium]|nr:terminase small subunit [Gammaproteobacteria bacterium]